MDIFPCRPKALMAHAVALAPPCHSARLSWRSSLRQWPDSHRPPLVGCLTLSGMRSGVRPLETLRNHLRTLPCDAA